MDGYTVPLLHQVLIRNEESGGLRVFVLLGAKHDHGLEGVPVLQHALQSQLGEAWRFQVMVRHVRVYNRPTPTHSQHISVTQAPRSHRNPHHGANPQVIPHEVYDLPTPHWHHVYFCKIQIGQ